MKSLFSFLSVAIVFLVAGASFADDAKPKMTEPPIVEPEYDGTLVAPPEGAVILFDGTSTEKWKQQSRKKAEEGADDSVKWTVNAEEGFMEIVPKTGSIITREKPITSGHLHLEWATPAEVSGKGQGRGNSGVFIEGFPEVQVLDSYENVTYFDGQAGALYKKSPPKVNASRGPGLWQCYDIYIQRAKVEEGKVVEPSTITVFHNGVLIQDGFEVASKVLEGTLSFQDHKNPVRYRNIWFLEGATRPE